MATKTSSGFHRRHNKLIFLILAISLPLILLSCGDGDSSSDSGSDTTGVGGSTARMTIAGDYLYAIADNDVQLFDITTPASPNPWVRVQVAWNIETLFPYGDYLLIGAADALHIMDNTDPGQPELLTTMPHATAQDPVVAENDFAYLTLRERSDFFGPQVDANELRVIDVRSMENPVLVDIIPMQHPSGLSVENNVLFVCDDIAGIKIFDTSEPLNLVSMGSIRDVRCNDLIAIDQRLYVITDNSVLQYDYTELPPILLSEVVGE